MRCPICKQGELKETKIREEQFGIDLGEYKGMQCSLCRETFFDEIITNKIMQKAKEKGIFGIQATTTVAKSGNSLAVRIPKKIAEIVQWKEGKEVHIHPAGKKIVIE